MQVTACTVVEDEVEVGSLPEGAAFSNGSDGSDLWFKTEDHSQEGSMCMSAVNGKLSLYTPGTLVYRCVFATVED